MDSEGKRKYCIALGCMLLWKKKRGDLFFSYILFSSSCTYSNTALHPLRTVKATHSRPYNVLSNLILVTDSY